jgi:regulator of nonsense transcripts 1
MLHTTRLHGVASDGFSSVNEHEATVTALCLVNLLYRKVKPEDIGVITFYNGQKTHLKKTLDSHFCIPDAYLKVRFSTLPLLHSSCFSGFYRKSILQRLTVDSVDGFQGRQKDYIILSCVRSGLAESTSVGFLANQRRMNVALTRARKGVIIVGNRNLLEKSDTWKAILTFYPTIQLEPALFALGVSNTKQLNCKYCENLPSGKH